MSAEKYCPTHGPYEARYATCPYCQKQGGRPPEPAPLDEQVTGSFQRYDDDLGTVPPRSRRGQDRAYVDEDLTELPRRRAGRVVDKEDLDETQMDRPQTGLLGWLIVKDGMRRGTVLRIGNGATLGRRNADVVIQDGKVSKLHAKFAIQACTERSECNEQFVVADMLSENGTYVNGEKISQVTALQENDEIRVGDTTLVLKILEP